MMMGLFAIKINSRTPLPRRILRGAVAPPTPRGGVGYQKTSSSIILYLLTPAPPTPVTFRHTPPATHLAEVAFLNPVRSTDSETDLSGLGELSGV